VCIHHAASLGLNNDTHLARWQ